MKNRRKARTFALQTLYAMTLRNQGVQDVVEGVLQQYEIDEAQRAYGMNLISLIQENKVELQKSLEAALTNWTWERVALIDQIVLLVGLAEMRYKPEVPHKVVLAESVAIANKFSSEESAGFVNGVLKSFLNSIPL